MKRMRAVKTVNKILSYVCLQWNYDDDVVQSIRGNVGGKRENLKVGKHFNLQLVRTVSQYFSMVPGNYTFENSTDGLRFQNTGSTLTGYVKESRKGYKKLRRADRLKDVQHCNTQVSKGFDDHFCQSLWLRPARLLQCQLWKCSQYHTSLVLVRIFCAMNNIEFYQEENLGSKTESTNSPSRDTHKTNCNEVH